MEKLIRLWYQPALVWYAKPLLLLSAIYRAIVFLRRCFYQLKPAKPADVPIIVVGNLTVGGSGKTPLVAWLANALLQQGHQPGIVSRGYGGRAKCYPHVVDQNSLPEEVGDEPLMLYLQTRCPVVVDPKRSRAVKTLLQRFPCDVIISDDGLQHLALPRTIEIIVLDGVRRLGNGCCLPAGPLREPASRLETADFVVVNGKTQQNNEITMQLIPEPLRLVIDPQEIINPASLAGKTLHAVAGIGFPQRFFQTLIQQGMAITTHHFADHHHYQPDDFSFLKADEMVVMTEKDAVKCRRFADARFCYLPVTASLPESAIFLAIIEKMLW